MPLPRPDEPITYEQYVIYKYQCSGQLDKYELRLECIKGEYQDGTKCNAP